LHTKKEPLESTVDWLLEEIRGYMSQDDGDIHTLEVNKAQKTIRLKVTGGCAHCTTNKTILHYSIQQAVSREFPDYNIIIEEGE